MLEGIVLAGGFGTRLRQVVPDLPKPMALISGRPFLEILLTDLAKKGFGRIVLSLGFMAEKIISHFGDNFLGMQIVYVIEKSPLGTGGAIKLAMLQCKEDHVFIFNGDTFFDLEVDAVESQWQSRSFPIIVGLEVPDTKRYGRLLIDGAQVKGFSEKNTRGPGLINAGCYVFNRKQLDAYPVQIPFSLETDYFSKVIYSTPFDLFVTSGCFIDIGVPEGYMRAQNELKKYMK